MGLRTVERRAITGTILRATSSALGPRGRPYLSSRRGGTMLQGEAPGFPATHRTRPGAKKKVNVLGSEFGGTPQPHGLSVVTSGWFLSPAVANEYKGGGLGTERPASRRPHRPETPRALGMSSWKKREKAVSPAVASPICWGVPAGHRSMGRRVGDQAAMMAVVQKQDEWRVVFQVVSVRT